MARGKKAVGCKVMMGGKLMFPNDYLSAVEFLGRDVTLTIKAVKAESLQVEDGGKEQKWVMTFVETPKKLVLNKTNTKSIGIIHGGEAEKWAGKRVTFYPTTCASFGEMVDCIRVREKAPAGKVQEQPREPGEDDFADDIAARMDTAA